MLSQRPLLVALYTGTSITTNIPHTCRGHKALKRGYRLPVYIHPYIFIYVCLSTHTTVWNTGIDGPSGPSEPVGRKGWRLPTSVAGGLGSEIRMRDDIHTSVHTCISIYTYTYMYTYTHVHVLHVYLCLRIHYICRQICKDRNPYVYIYIHVDVCAYTHMYIHTRAYRTYLQRLGTVGTKSQQLETWNLSWPCLAS